MSGSGECGCMAAPGPHYKHPEGRGLSEERAVEGLLQVQGRYLPSAIYTSLTQEEPGTRQALLQWALEVSPKCMSLQVFLHIFSGFIANLTLPPSVRSCVTQVCHVHGCAGPVFPLAVSLLDCFLSVTLTLPLSPLCLTATCILIASKLADVKAVRAHSLCAAASFNFLPKHLHDMESIVLVTLRWDVAAVTAHDFLPHLLSVVRETEGHVQTEGDTLLAALRNHSETLVALCCYESRLLGTPPSLIAVAALNCALEDLWRQFPESHSITAMLARLCKLDLAVVQCISELIGNIFSELQNDSENMDKDKLMKEERASTPTDLRDINF